HVLAGVPPFDGDAIGLALRHLNDDPEPPSRRAPHALPPAADAVILELLAKDPDARPTPLVAAVDRLLKPGRRRRLSSLAIDAVIVGAVLATVVVYAGDRTSSPSAPDRTGSPALSPVYSMRALDVAIDSDADTPRPRGDGKLLVNGRLELDL